MDLASRMQRFKVEDVLVYTFLMKEWKPHLIREYLAQFTEKNYFVTLQSNEDSNYAQTLEELQIKYNITDLQKLKPLSFLYEF